LTPRLRAGHHGRRIKNGTVLFVKIGERHRMHFLGGAQATMKVAASEGEARIRNQIGLKSKVSRHADSRFDGVVSAHSGNDESPNLVLS
jgi:hypothetical protein